jgi:hypothetical protein
MSRYSFSLSPAYASYNGSCASPPALAAEASQLSLMSWTMFAAVVAAGAVACLIWFT